MPLRHPVPRPRPVQPAVGHVLPDREPVRPPGQCLQGTWRTCPVGSCLAASGTGAAPSTPACPLTPSLGSSPIQRAGLWMRQVRVWRGEGWAQHYRGRQGAWYLVLATLSFTSLVRVACLSGRVPVCLGPAGHAVRHGVLQETLPGPAGCSAQWPLLAAERHRAAPVSLQCPLAHQ